MAWNWVPQGRLQRLMRKVPQAMYSNVCKAYFFRLPQPGAIVIRSPELTEIRISIHFKWAPDEVLQELIERAFERLEHPSVSWCGPVTERYMSKTYTTPSTGVQIGGEDKYKRLELSMPRRPLEKNLMVRNNDLKKARDSLKFAYLFRKYNATEFHGDVQTSPRSQVYKLYDELSANYGIKYWLSEKFYVLLDTYPKAEEDCWYIGFKLMSNKLEFGTIKEIALIKNGICLDLDGTVITIGVPRMGWVMEEAVNLYDPNKEYLHYTYDDA